MLPLKTQAQPLTPMSPPQTAPPAPAALPGNQAPTNDAVRQKTARIDVINPTPKNNPMGSGFPGFRASNQIILYDAGYGRPNTGTNEFGFEVTVRNGIVTAQEGSDSAIPPDGFVLSGHGRGRAWLIENAPLGARIVIAPAASGPDGVALNGTVTATINMDTYVYQFNQRWAESPCGASAWSANPSVDPLCADIRKKKEEAVRLVQDAQQSNQQDGQSESAAIALLGEAMDSLNRRTWLSYTPFPPQSVRGAWHRPVEKTAEAIGRRLDTLKAAGLNAVFLETFFHGYTIFPSETYQAYGLPPENPKFAGVDLLKLWVDEAHRRGMQVHVWFQTFYAGSRAAQPPGPILARYPAWANVQASALVRTPVNLPVSIADHSADTAAKAGEPVSGKPSSLPVKAAVKAPPGREPAAKESAHPVAEAGASIVATPQFVLKAPAKPVPSTLETGGYFIDPVNPDAQAFLLKLAGEIVSHYAVDGFQLDYIRYPASFPADRFSYRKTTWGYTDIARSLFKVRYGVDPANIDPRDPAMATVWMAWSDFKTQQVNHFVERITAELRRRRPDLRISAAIFPDAGSALALKHQDWATWGRKGWIDFYAPMTLTSALKVIERDTQAVARATSRQVPVNAGIFGPFNNNTPDQVLSQLNTAKQAGAQGYILFDTAHLSARTMDALETVQSPRPAAVAPALVPAEAPQPSVPPARVKKRHWWNRR
jgi:uncharacterized lipoprotein YddW (UPF0748 family)